MKNELKEIPTIKLEKIHYATLQLILAREKAGQLTGKQVKLTPSFLVDIFKQADKDIFNAAEKPSEDLLGIHYYLAALKALPIERVKMLEINQAKEIKRRRELKRQRLDAGNIENEVKRACQP